ncbi:MAG: 8-amino-7-oxononanoate synthase [Thermoguttaceae bacterium]|nr:8-amino-7-oxononanoate synthase [Thermoguttaceae bacterium]MDW8039649.1 8-amino-7-oxononanoate synthase [Thermoguttaceae bacterium]
MSKELLGWIETELARLEQAGLRRRRRVRQGPQGPVVVLDGRELINFGSNDYLGLAADERLKAAAAAALQEGWGAGASPLVCGYSSLHQQLEKRLAEFEGTEAALVFGSGFAANIGTIAALVGPGDVVYMDAKNHASLWDGARLSRADVRVYGHGDYRELARLLERAGRYRRRLIVTDSVFSMDGDLAPLPELVELAYRYDAMLLVDEAHATGVFGTLGRGVAEHLGVEKEIPIRIGTLSKALGSVGGFVVGADRLIDWLVQRARPYVFSTAPPAAMAAAALAALEIVQAEPVRRRRLLESAEYVRSELRGQGWRLGPSASQIIPVLLGEPATALEVSAALVHRGLFVPPIRPPAVPEGQCCVRISLCASHSPRMVENLLEAFANLSKKFL